MKKLRKDPMYWTSETKQFLTDYLARRNRTSENINLWKAARALANDAWAEMQGQTLDRTRENLEKVLKQFETDDNARLIELTIRDCREA